MKQNLREKYEKGVLELGYQKLNTDTKRYWVYHKHGASMPYVFLGKAGAVRGGRTQRVDLSFPLSPSTKQHILMVGEFELKPPSCFK